MQWVVGVTGVWFLGEMYDIGDGAPLSPNWQCLGLRLGLGIRYKVLRG